MGTKEKDQVLQAIRRLGRRVTVADVATKTGLPLQIVSSQLNKIASETGGDLQVATTGDIAYSFSPGFQNAYLASGIKRVVLQVGSTLFKVAFYILRISFGVMLVLSLLAIVILAFLLITTLQRVSSSDDDRGSGFDFNLNIFDYLILRDLFWWGTWSALPGRYSHEEPAVRQRGNGNFFLDCFSFLFGDGNPNAHLEERRWRLIAQAIKRNNGVVTAEQLAPYTGKDPKNENGVLPVLVRFDGRPEVTDSGNIVYLFPSLQVSAGRQSGAESEDEVAEPERSSNDRFQFQPVGRFSIQNVPRPFLNEFPWKFSNTQSGSLVPVGILAGVNFFGAWWLFFQLHSPLGLVLHSFGLLIGALVVYGTLFVALPLARWLVLQYLNARINSRNEQSSRYAEQLLDPPGELLQKLNEAQSYKVKEELISQDKVVYTTEKDALEQEFESGT